MIRFRSIRVRLAAWYLVVLALSLAVFAVGSWFALSRSLMLDVDADLYGHMTGLRQSLQADITDDDPHEVDREIHEYAVGLTEGYLMKVWDPQGRVLFSSAGFDVPAPAAGTHLQTFDLHGKPLRTLSEPVVFFGHTYQVEFAAELDLVEQMLSRFRSILLSLVPVLLLLAVAGGYWISRRALDPVDQLTRAARSISVQNLSERLKVPRTGDELQHLAETWNEMLDRLEDSVRRITQFTADASHELRTPLSLVQTTAELALRRPRTADEYRDALHDVVLHTERTTSLLEDLLILARADSGKRAFTKAAVDVRDLVQDVSEQMKPLAQHRGIALDWELPGCTATVSGDRGALRRMVIALVDNALKYTVHGGSVHIGLRVEAAQALIEVRDTGSGVAPEDAPHIFDRFYRADKARSSASEGFGLGLAIAREIADAHGGRIELATEHGKGSAFTVHLPAELAVLSEARP